MFLKIEQTGKTQSRWRQDLAVSLLGLLLLVGWELTGWDFAMLPWFGNEYGFAWHHEWPTSTLVHGGGRIVAWAVLFVLLFDAFKPLVTSVPSPARAQRWRWFGVLVLCLLLVPSLKSLSSTSCPWDLVAFGGVASYVPHWRLGVTDGGPGRCFPSGHAVAAFAFFSTYFLWRDAQPVWARRWLIGVLVVGALFGWVQLARGAHYVSHTLWSAWLCWALCSAFAAGFSWRDRVPSVPPA